MKRALFFAAAFALLPLPAVAIQRDPTGVSVNVNGPTTVFITFGGLKNQVPSESLWCGELISAAPDIGLKCNPATIFGRLPARYDLSRESGSGGFTDIMSIPVTVARRAYEDAAAGKESRFFYVRKFVSTNGGPDEYVSVTCRLTGGGARVPLALTDVQMTFDSAENVLSWPVGQVPPPFHADIRYNGTGRLIGRWEVVLPADEPPTAEDLLPEGSLPVEQRSLQKRYTQLDRFNVFLPPTGKVRIDGPDPSRLPVAVPGLYLVLLRIEASNDREADSNLAAAGAGTGVVHSGGMAGFPLPPLRYYIGSAVSMPDTGTAGSIRLLEPAADAALSTKSAMEFAWIEDRRLPLYRIEVRDGSGATVLAAIVQPDIGRYRAPSWFQEKVPAGPLSWRVVAVTPEGSEIDAADWRPFSRVAGE